MAYLDLGTGLAAGLVLGASCGVAHVARQAKSAIFRLIRPDRSAPAGSAVVWR